MKEWLNQEYLKNSDALTREFTSNKPFPHLVLPEFFSNRIESVEKAILKEPFAEQNSDLFQFQQTDDCKNATQKALKEFHSFFGSKEFISFISSITKTRLKSIDMSGFIYDDTDYLLPHDDRLEGRKVAYIVNLSRGFDAADGGALQFFEGTKIVKSIIPSFNTFSIFKVSAKSLHQVQEVYSDKKRVTLTGWFHG